MYASARKIQGRQKQIKFQVKLDGLEMNFLDLNTKVNAEILNCIYTEEKILRMVQTHENFMYFE